MEALSCAFLVHQSIHFLAGSDRLLTSYPPVPIRTHLPEPSLPPDLLFERSRHFLAAPGNTLSSHLDMKAPISWLFFSNIIMCPLPRMPTSASLIQVG
jgi:hypothetical protein